MRHRCSMLTLVLGLVLLAAPAAAQKDDLAKGHYMAGQAYYNQARYSEAIREFQEAYRLSPKPALLYNIAQAYERMGKVDEAIANLKRYLADAPDASDRAAVEERLKNLQERMKQTGVSLSCEVAGASVLVDGKEVGKTPLTGPIPLAPGSHDVKVTKDGYEPFSAFISVNAGQTVQVAAKLTPARGVTPPVGGAGPASKRSYLWTWILGGTAAALLITGGVTGGVALSKAGAAKTKTDSDADTAKTLAIVSDVTIGVGAAAAVTATILFFVERRRGREAPSSATVVPMLGPTTAGLNARFDF